MKYYLEMRNAIIVAGGVETMNVEYSGIRWDTYEEAEREMNRAGSFMRNRLFIKEEDDEQKR